MASFAIGGIGLVIPAIVSYRKCVQLCRDVRSHLHDIRVEYSSLLVQKDLFESECLHLLETLIPEDYAKEMLADTEHRLWRSVQFESDFLRSLSTGQREALTLIRNSIEGIETDLQYYKDNQFTWALDGKTKVRRSLETLRYQMMDLKALREARRRPSGNNKAPQRREKQARPRSEALRFPMRHSAKRLYSNLKPVVCQCHCLNLKLDDAAQQEESMSGAEFSFMVTDSSCSINMCLSIISSRRNGVEEGMVETTNGASVGSVIPRATSDLDTINGLCPLTLPKTIASTTPRVYLGTFKDKTESKYTHLVYQHRDAMDRLSRISLAKHLESNTFPRRRRLHLAMLLATALLHYGSFRDSWFKDFWGSGDVFFFIDHDQGLLPTSIPHIAIPKSEPKHSRRRAPVNNTPVKNNHLLSLAVVMTEIAFGEALCPDQNGSSDTNSAERDKIREHLYERTRFRGAVGRKYAEAVATCLNSDYTLGSGDLKEKDVRDAFYENVVLKLERCVEELDKV
ncbi:hypothetical protein K440DRAFT_665249 [Wilcoxina mikolae CBS 423.85]|nr:hypothetical protein K440DRAFT_665249 [Wilcoxina mikolae CBS 423.85]